MNTLEQLFRNPFLHQFAEDGDGLALRSNHSDVAGLSLHRPPQHAHIVVVPTGYDHDVRSLIGSDSRHRAIKIFGYHFFRFGKTLAIRIALTVVNYVYVE